MTNKTLPYTPSETTVMLLAAGEGRRMLPLTKSKPKPLLEVKGRPLIEHHLLKLQLLGFRDIVINTAHLGLMIQDQIGNGSQFGLNINYSDESKTGALETAGGIVKALPLISSDPFLVVNADIWTDFNFSSLLSPLNHSGRLVLVSNPEHNPQGDFSIDTANRICLKNLQTKNKDHPKTYTFSGIATYKKSIFKGLDSSKQPLAPILHKLIQQQELDVILHEGIWTDVGTPERLKELN